MAVRSKDKLCVMSKGEVGSRVAKDGTERVEASTGGKESAARMGLRGA